MELDASDFKKKKKKGGGSDAIFILIRLCITKSLKLCMWDGIGFNHWRQIFDRQAL